MASLVVDRRVALQGAEEVEHPALAALEAWLQLLELRGLPEEVRTSVRRKATEEDSLVSETRLHEILARAGFETPLPIYRAQLLGTWLARKVRR